MPSNAMKISQLMVQLQGVIDQHGDLDCVLALTRDAEVYAIDGRNVNVAGGLAGRTLPSPVLMFGLSVLNDGTTTQSAGTAYQVTASDDPWRYNRDDAPQDVDLDVWRRSGVVHDIGRRLGADWFVYNGSFGADDQHLVQIVPEGILAWMTRP